MPQISVVVPDALLEELVSLRISYARLLRLYQEELENSPKAREVFVKTVPAVLRERKLRGSDCDFQSYFEKLVDEEVSLFNIHHLKGICDEFPSDIWYSNCI